MFDWRPMTEEDVPAVLEIAARVHPSLPERAAVFLERILLFPAGSLVLAKDQRLGGYAVSHPIRAFAPPPLDTLLGAIDGKADDYFLHDFALLPERRGEGHARRGIGRLLRIAERYPSASLISVYSTAGFWRRFGFEAQTDGAMRDRLAAYGTDALYMTRGRPAA